MRPARLLVATHNAGKLEEFRQLLAPLGVAVIGAAELGLAAPAETGTTFAENARIKARAAQAATGLPALGDDSGLEVDGLGGAPGVHTADWAEGPGGRDFLRAMTRVRDELLGRGVAPPWTARFRCTLVLADPGGGERIFEGVVEGELVWPVRGALGHGFDPMFVPEGRGRTFAEMDAAEKNAISHRGQALAAFLAAVGAGWA
jgi:XTP/dITP diphosphohydrolase